MTEFKVGDTVVVTGDDAGTKHRFPAGGIGTVTEVDGDIEVRYDSGLIQWVGPQDLLHWEPAVSHFTVKENGDVIQNVEMVNHPDHYNLDPSGVECIDIVRHRNFNVGNAIKYLWRAGLKGDESKTVEDLRKAVFYINDEIERLESAGS